MVSDTTTSSQVFACGLDVQRLQFSTQELECQRCI